MAAPSVFRATKGVQLIAGPVPSPDVVGLVAFRRCGGNSRPINPWSTARLFCPTPGIVGSFSSCALDQGGSQSQCSTTGVLQFCPLRRAAPSKPPAWLADALEPASARGSVPKGREEHFATDVRHPYSRRAWGEKMRIPRRRLAPSRRPKSV